MKPALRPRVDRRLPRPRSTRLGGTAKTMYGLSQVDDHKPICGSSLDALEKKLKEIENQMDSV